MRALNPLLLSPALFVAACGEPAAPPAVEPTPPAIILGGVNLGDPLRILGTEPFWGIDMTPQGLTYSGVDRPEQTAPNPGPAVQGTTAVVETTTSAGLALRIMLIDTDCSDGMSDRVYPLTARVELGEEILQGCAISTAGLAAQPPV